MTLRDEIPEICDRAEYRMKPIGRKEWYLLLIAVVLSLIIHAFFLFDGFGEPDAARLATQAALIKYNHQESGINKISPLYQWILIVCLNHGMDMRNIPVLMNLTNLFLGSFILIPFYWLLKMISRPLTAALSILLYEFTPAFWFANLYGMPHLPAFFFLLWAGVAYVKMLDSEGISFVRNGIISIGLMFLALSCKMDVALYSGLFLGLFVICKKRADWDILWAILIPCIALTLSISYANFMNLRYSLNLHFISRWHERWPTDLTALKSVIPVRSVGVIFFAGIIFSGIYCLIKSSLRRYLYFSVFFAAPAVLFWCLRWGNSIRHMMVASSVLIFLLSVSFVDVFKSRRKLYFVIPVLLVLNYFFMMPIQDYNVNAGGRLFETARRMQAYHNEIKENALDLFQTSDEEVVLVGREAVPFVIWELLIWYELEGVSRDNFSYEFYDFKQKKWKKDSTEMVAWTLRGHDGFRRTIQYIYVPLNIAILDDDSHVFWSCEKRVKIIRKDQALKVDN